MGVHLDTGGTTTQRTHVDLRLTAVRLTRLVMYPKGIRMRFFLTTSVVAISFMLILTGCGTLAEGKQQTSNDATAHERSPLSPCGATVYVHWKRPHVTLESLSWASHQVVLGVVIEQSPSQFGQQFAADLEPTARHVVTDYVVKVESRLRGAQSETVTVRRLGGTVDDCTVIEADTNDSQFVIGQRVLLFLNIQDQFDMSSSNVPHMVTGGPQGIWKVRDDGTLQPTDLFNAVTLPGDQGWTTAAESILASLDSGTPPSNMPKGRIVPLDLAPVPSGTDLNLPQDIETSQ